MAHRIEIASTIPDTRAAARKKKLEKIGLAGKISGIELVDVYTIDANLTGDELNAVASIGSLSNSCPISATLMSDCKLTKTIIVPSSSSAVNGSTQHGEILKPKSTIDPCPDGLC